MTLRGIKEVAVEPHEDGMNIWLRNEEGALSMIRLVGNDIKLVDEYTGAAPMEHTGRLKGLKAESLSGRYAR